jgi:hypothetical protein
MERPLPNGQPFSVSSYTELLMPAQNNDRVYRLVLWFNFHVARYPRVAAID